MKLLKYHIIEDEDAREEEVSEENNENVDLGDGEETRVQKELSDAQGPQDDEMYVQNDDKIHVVKLRTLQNAFALPR